MVALTRRCARLHDGDIVSCLRSVPVQNLAGSGLRRQVDLIRKCNRLPDEARLPCYSWFGRTLSVVTDGTFGRTGCARLDAEARAACSAGARQTNRPLVTFA